MVIAICGSKRKKLAGNSKYTGDLSNARSSRFGDRSTEKLGSSAAPDRQIGAMLSMLCCRFL